MLRWFRSFLPREERFFDLFARHSQTVVQGALALQVRAGEAELVSSLDHSPSHRRVDAERARVAELGGGCTVPVAAHAWFERGELQVQSWVAP